MISLDEFLILEPEGKLLEGEEGSAHLNSPIKPTTGGFKMIDAPNGVSNGLAYRINGCNLERILVTEDEDNTSSTKVVSSCILLGAIGAVHLKASPDGRLVAVACIDGSIQCYDSTATNISLRWSIPHAHSHVTSNISNSMSADRKHAACGSGPVLALDFSPYNYNLVLVDAIKGMAIYDARGAEPINLISPASPSQQKLVENVSSASWRVSIPTKECDGPIPIAVGRLDGSIAILSCNSKLNSIDVLEPISEISCPSEEDGFVCTHLNWTSNTLVAGLCRVIPPEDKEAPDEDDEDDNADHEACLYLTSIDDSLSQCNAWMEQGDVVPFFTVPKFGRHVFFTSFLPSAARSELIAVGTNVGSDIGTIFAQNESNDNNDTYWQPVEFQEGAAATTPTNEDDEYAFPLGISILQLSSSSFRLLLAATDGSLSTFKFQHKNDSEYFSSTVLGSTADLPSEPLVTMIESLSETSNSTSPPLKPENTSWVVVDENKNDNLGAEEAPVLPTATITESKTEEVPPANTTNSSFSVGSSESSGFSFKAGTTQTATESTGTQKEKNLSFGAPGSSVFGSGNTCGLTFGNPNSGSSPLTSLEKKVGEMSGFGAVSSPCVTTPPVTSTPGEPTNASGSIGTYGSPLPIGGFAALSSGSSKNSTTESGAFGSSNAASFRGSAFGSSPFNSFSKSSASVSTTGGFPVKPLFGKASAPPTSTNEPTTFTTSSPSLKSPISFPPTTTSSDLKATGSPRKEDISSSTKAENLHRTDKEELTGIEKTASCVFDKFDPTNSGFVPVSLFEEMSDALGEGFHGDEYDAQVNCVDPSKLGKITRSAFLAWYTSLVEGSDEDASLDSVDKEERAEEEKNAKTAFQKLSKTEGEISYITLNQFGELFESMGSTYCEEEHKKTLKKLKKDTDRIYQTDFLIWYINWLFDDEDSSDDYSDGDNESDDEETNNVNTNGGKEESLGSIFKIDEDSWRCEVCSVRNKESDNQCVACETFRTGAIIPTVNTTNKAKGDPGSSSSIGVGGFSFEGKITTGTTSTSAIGAGGFSFGGESSTSSSGGFKFNSTSIFTSNSIDNTNTPVPVGGFSFKSDTAVASSFLLSSSNGSGTDLGGQSKLPASNCGTFGKKNSDNSGTFATIPPIPSKAPSPFGAKTFNTVEKAPVRSGTFAAIPPMSKKAPSPFGAKSSNTAEKAPVKSGTFATIPPMSSKAPSPFGAKTSKTVEKAPVRSGTFAARPPMSSKVPTPFGAKSSKPAEKSAPAINSPFAAFPPTSSKAPSPFGGKSSKPAEKEALASNSPFAAFPPTSSKAPSPFGGKSSKPAEKEDLASNSPFAAIPPTSSKALPPFGGKSSKPAEKEALASKSPFAAFLPTSSKAPSPFGATSSKPTEKANLISNDTFVASPPKSSKAPYPFGATSSKPIEKADPTSNDTFAAPPPMSSKAPSPFGLTPSKPTEKNSASTYAALPSMSNNSSSPFAAKPSKPAEKSSTFTGNIVSSQISTSLDTKYTPFGATVPQNLARLSRKKTKIQIQFDSVINSFSRTVAEVSQMRAEASLDDNELQHKIEDLATHIQQERLILLNLDDSIRENRGETAFFLSRKTDSSRQIDAARKMIREIKLLDMDAESSVVYTQGLDQESETKRRRFAASSRSIVRQMALARERVELLEATSDGHFYGKQKLLQGVLNLYKRSKYFKKVSSRIQEKINVASRFLPFNQRAKRVGTGQSTYALETQSFKSSKHLNKLRPIALGSGEYLSTKQQQARSSRPLAFHWKNIELSLKQIGNENIKIDRFNTLSAKCANNNQLLRDRKKEVREQRPVIRSLLMSPSVSEKPSGNRIQENSLILSKRASIFSTPLKTKARNGWDQPSTIDQNRIKQLSLAAPRDLNQTTLSNASRETLASFGTTPEKLQAATEMKKRESSSLAPDKVHPSVVKTKRSTGAKAVLPPKSNKAPTNPIFNEKKKETVAPLSSTPTKITKSIASSAPLPPMPKQAPKNPFSKDSSTRSQDKSSNSSALSVPKSFSELQQNRITEGESLNSKKSEVSSGTFGNMNTISNSLFSSESRKTDTNPEPLQPISSLSNTSEAGKTNSFISMLTSFYQKHNPLKVGEVKKTLEKYDGRESEMFAKLAAKYKVPNPLEGMTKKSASDCSSVSSGFGNLGSTSALPPISGFCATGVTTSPFSSSSGTTGPQQNPANTSSPFGSSGPASSPTLNTGMFSSNSGGFQASTQSPFGTSNSSTNTAAFGRSPSATNSTVPAQSPFGESTPFGAKTTGGFGNTTTPTPFGAPAPSPMQSNLQQLFNGRTARDLLLQFYQEKNPSKVTEVDKLLTKYRGNEDQMFRNLAKKYHLDCSVFGISSTTPNPGYSSVVATPAFSQASTMGGGPSPFGQSPGGFGQPSPLGGGNGMSSSSPAGQTFGSGSTASYGTSNFGSLTQASPSPFGGQSSNFGSGNTGFGGSATPAFGGSPFGAARR